jgi:hypothetical protein
MYEMKVLLNTAGATQAAAGTTTDLTPSASINRREMKVIVVGQVLTAGTFPLSIAECDTTNGTFTAVSGDTIANVVATQAAVAVAEYHVFPTKRYLKASVGTVAGTGAAANLTVLLMNLKRSSM